MKRYLGILLFAAVASGCTAGSGVLLLNAKALDATCTPQDLFVARGSINVGVAGSDPLQYLAAFEMQSELSSTPTTIGGQVTNPASNNDFIVQRAVLRYFQVVAGAVQEMTAIPEQQMPVHFVIPAGADREDAYVIIPMIAAAADLPIRGLTLPATISVRLRLEGRLVAGTPMRTNEVEFPIYVYSDATCAITEAPCGNPQQAACGEPAPADAGYPVDLAP